MNRSLRILRQLLSSYLSASLMYRFDFLQSIVSSLLWSGLSFASAILITSQTPGVPGMERSDLLLLSAAYGVIIGTHHWLCSHGFGTMSEIIHKGELEGYLLKPFDTLTLLSLRNIAWGSVFRVLGSIAFLAWLLNFYSIPVTALSVLSFVLLGSASFFLIYSLYSLCCTVLIWHPYLSNIFQLIQNSTGTARYPLDIRRYTPLILVIFYLPFLLVVNIPLRALTGRLSLLEGVYFFIFCIGAFLFSRWFWRRALWSYTGASG